MCFGVLVFFFPILWQYCLRVVYKFHGDVVIADVPCGDSPKLPKPSGAGTKVPPATLSGNLAKLWLIES